MSKPNWTPIVIRLGDIIPWTHNPRMSNRSQAQRLIDSEKKWGQPLPFSVSPCVDGKYQLYDGHQRYSAFLTVYGENHKVAASMCDRELTDAERAELVFTLHAGATGSWDWDKVASFPEATQWGFDADLLKDWNNNANNLKELLNSEQVESADAEPQIDRAAELQEKWQVKTGDLWQIGEHRLLCGDCTDPAGVVRVMEGEKAEIVFTDPPYKMTVSGGGSLHESYAPIAARIEEISDFDPSLFLSVLPSVFGKGHHSSFIFCSKDLLVDYLVYARENKLSYNVLVWKKKLVTPFGDSHRPDIEYIVFLRKNAKWNNGLSRANYSRCLDYEQIRYEAHPTMKPVELIGNQLEITTDSGDVVIDFYCGSGSTLIACQNLGRRGRGIEISPAYCAVTLERMATAFPHLEIKRLE